MMTQVDELNSERHLQMSISEFIEAVCRVADKAVIPNFFRDTEYKSLDDFLSKSGESHLQKLKSRPIHEKIEAYLILLGRQCLPRVVQLV